MDEKFIILLASLLATVSGKCPNDNSPNQIDSTSGIQKVKFAKDGRSKDVKCEMQFTIPSDRNQYLVINFIAGIPNPGCIAYYAVYSSNKEKSWPLIRPGCSNFTIVSSETCMNGPGQPEKECWKKEITSETFGLEFSFTGTENPAGKYQYLDCFQMQYEFINCNKATIKTSTNTKITTTETTTPKPTTTPTTTTKLTTTTAITPKPTTTPTTTTNATTTPTTTTNATTTSTTTTKTTSTSTTTTKPTTTSTTTKPTTVSTTTTKATTTSTTTTKSITSSHSQTATSLKSTMASGNVNASINTSKVSTTAPTQTDSKLFAIVFGITIPLVIVVVGIAVWCCKQRKQVQNKISVDEVGKDIDLESVARYNRDSRNSCDSVCASGQSPEVVYSVVNKKPTTGSKKPAARYPASGNELNEPSSHEMVDNVIYEMQ